MTDLAIAEAHEKEGHDGLGVERDDAVLDLVGISKSFPGVRALSGVDLACAPGRVHALVGENGSGKSTLVKVAAGVLRPDQGTITIDGTKLEHASPLAARRLGLQAAYQDTALVRELSVLENVMLSFHGTRGYHRRLKRQHAARLLAAYDLDFSPQASVASLTPGMRQLLEIVRALIHRPKVLLLDEPTATLDADSIERLEALIRDCRTSDTAILYITHRLEEVERLADTVTVLRDGEVQASRPAAGWSLQEMVSLMVGAPLDLTFPDKPEDLGGRPVALEVGALSGTGFGPVDLRVRSGEIVGIAGAEGNGQRELVRTLVGLLSGKGEVKIEGAPVSTRSPATARAGGITFLSGDRVAESIFMDMSVMQNSTLPAVDQLGRLATVRRKRERSLFGGVAQRLGIVAASPDQPIRSLSGGNQQKSVMARALVDPAKVLVVDEPTQGVDAKSRLDLYGALRAQAEEGAAIVVNSSDSLELSGLCDRVYVVSRGVITEELTGEDLTEESIVHGFVTTDQKADERGQDGTSGISPVARTVAAPWFPLTVLAALILLVGGYTATQSSVFLNDLNLAHLFVLSLPLMVVAIAQQTVMLTAGFDISVGSLMSLTIVFASFNLTSESLGPLIPGILLILALGFVVGLVNGLVVRVLNVNAIIATIGMLGILAGIALMRRPEPEGIISLKLEDILLHQVGFVPVAVIVIAVGAVAAQIALLHTGAGLNIRATGFDDESSRRVGLPVRWIAVGGFVGCSMIAAVAGLFLAAQTGIGDPNAGASYALLSIAACVIGGASLQGGRGSFVGAVIAALFLTLLVNVAPLLQISPAYSQLATGVLTLLAVLAYTLNRRMVI